jgi:hypothetical protein
MGKIREGRGGLERLKIEENDVGTESTRRECVSIFMRMEQGSE